MTTLTYQNVTKEQIDAMHQQLEDGGAEITLQQNGGFDIEGHGVEMLVIYNPGASTLTVNIVHKPFIVPVSVIDHAIKTGLGLGSPLPHQS